MTQIEIERKTTKGRERVLLTWKDTLGMTTYRWVWADDPAPKWGFLNKKTAEQSFRLLNKNR